MIRSHANHRDDRLRTGTRAEPPNSQAELLKTSSTLNPNINPLNPKSPQPQPAVDNALQAWRADFQAAPHVSFSVQARRFQRGPS